MFRKFLLLLSLLFINPVYAATFSWALTNYAVNENVKGNAASLTIKRDTGSGSAIAKIEIQILGTTATKGVNYNINDPRTTWTVGPPDYYNLSFSAGETSKKIYLKIIDDPTSMVNKRVVFKLSTSSSGYTISGNNLANLTIVNTTLGSQGGGSVSSNAEAVDYYGNPVVTYNPANTWLTTGANAGDGGGGNFINGKYCFLQVDGGGYCGMSFMKDNTTCHTAPTNYIASNFQVNLVGLESLSSSYFGFKQNLSSAITIRFQTASAAEKAKFPNNIQYTKIEAVRELTAFDAADAKSLFISISKTRCDFTYSKISSVPNCYKSGSLTGTLGNFLLTITRSPATIPTGACELDLDTKYYINIRIEKASSPGVKVDACENPSQTDVCRYGLKLDIGYVNSL